MPGSDHLPFKGYRPRSDRERVRRATNFARELGRRRSVRHFSNRPVPRKVIEACLAAAASAPSGANLQPWHFVAIGNPALKRQIREAAEAEERAFYEHRAPADWLAALAPLGTDANKPFLETAPWLIAIFVQRRTVGAGGVPTRTYYPTESVGIATGILITALHHAGLATLTHTPSPMNFLNRLLNRPATEKPFLLLVTGHPSPEATVPDLKRKPLSEVTTFC